jgi:hypothetical protein
VKIFKNSTRIPDEDWKALIRFAKPNGLNLDGWRFQFQQAKIDSTSGRMMGGRWMIHLRVGNKNWRMRRHYEARRGYLEYTLYTFFERVLFVLAHELRHAWQKQNPNGRKVWGAKGRYSERDADAYAIRKVREYRRNGMGDYAIPASRGEGWK